VPPLLTINDPETEPVPASVPPLLTASDARAVTIEIVPIRNAGNAADEGYIDTFHSNGNGSRFPVGY
jgi:hypothetical protein